MASCLYIRRKKIEKHYYREKKGIVSEINDPIAKTQIDEHILLPGNLPPESTARETGCSSIELDSATQVDINPSMLGTSSSSHSLIISRLKIPPALPVSCLAAAEHVIAMQNRVSDFVSELEPASKKRVMYRIFARLHSHWNYIKEDEQRLFEAILNHDAQLSENDIMISTDRKSKLCTIEVNTQNGDIQNIIKAIKGVQGVKILNAEFNEIGINEGICLINGDGSNPIHALVNIANVNDKKCFLERDAGLMTGSEKSNLSYRDRHWTFNAYSDLSEIQQQSGYKKNSIAVKLFLQPRL